MESKRVSSVVVNFLKMNSVIDRKKNKNVIVADMYNFYTSAKTILSTLTESLVKDFGDKDSRVKTAGGLCDQLLNAEKANILEYENLSKKKTSKETLDICLDKFTDTIKSTLKEYEKIDDSLTKELNQ
jgi:hypothetical protein